MEIFKLQLPLGGAMTEAFIYNKDRSLMDHIPITKDVIALFPQGTMKIYFRGVFDPETGNIEMSPNDVLKPEEWPDW